MIQALLNFNFNLKCTFIGWVACRAAFGHALENIESDADECGSHFCEFHAFCLNEYLGVLVLVFIPVSCES